MERDRDLEHHGVALRALVRAEEPQIPAVLAAEPVELDPIPKSSGKPVGPLEEEGLDLGIGLDVLHESAQGAATLERGFALRLPDFGDP